MSSYKPGVRPFKAMGLIRQVPNFRHRPKGALEWARNHASKFELDKTGLIVFSNRRIPDPARPHKTIAIARPPVTINGQEIKASQSLKFLGVILDQELRFKAQADHADQEDLEDHKRHQSAYFEAIVQCRGGSSYAIWRKCLAHPHSEKRDSQGKRSKGLVEAAGQIG